MRALITGGAGFIGSHLAQALVQLGYQVDCVDNLSTGSKQNIKLLCAQPGFRFHYGFAEDVALMEPLVTSADVVFHLAASVGVKNILANPIQCIENNIYGTSVVLRLCDRYRKRVFTFSTSEVYGKSPRFPFREDDDVVLGPVHKLRWSYAASKLLDDYLARAYFEENGTPVTIVRLFNTIGRGQVGEYGMVVPRFFAQALRDEPLTVYGSGRQTRCFTDVRDVIEALIGLIAVETSYGELINVGSDQEISILELGRLICRIANSSSSIEHVTFEQAYGASFEDMDRRVPSSHKLGQLTGFEFRYCLEDTLRWIHSSFGVESDPPLELVASGI